MTTNWIAFLYLVWVATCLGQPLDDIFSPDKRTPADTEQVRWTVNVGGCSGSMLTPEHVLTANHCRPRVGATYTSGGCLALGCRSDLQVTERVECSSSLDYCILKVKSSHEEALAAQRYTPQVQVDETELKFGKDGEATALYTVGFPGDTRRATYSPGYAKKYSGDDLYYNLGSINGNSGGAVWTQEGHVLVSFTNFGPHMLGQPGWDKNDPEDPSAWNGGARVDRVYRSSRTLQALFPGGKNPLTRADGTLK